MPPFAAAEIKLRRALFHIANLESEVSVFMSTNPVRATATVTDGTRIDIRMDWDGPPETIGAIVGDIIHNLRAALDLAACDLVRIRNGNDNGVYFPFCDRPEELDQMIRRRNFKRAGPQAVALMHKLRPYRNGNAALRAIHDLDIQDKHHSLIPGVMSHASPAFRLRNDDGRPHISVFGDPNAASEIKLIFPEDSALGGRELIPTLHELVELVASIVEAFRSLPPD
jgi:hypothetical protein